MDATGYKTSSKRSTRRRRKDSASSPARSAGTTPRYLEAMKRVQDGAIGDVVAARAYWNQGGLWNKPRQSNWSDMEYQVRNWLYFTWLSGDHIVEQHVHNLDVVNWGVGSIPIKAVGMGGRQVRDAAGVRPHL